MEIMTKKEPANLIEQQFWLLNNQTNGSSYNVNSMFLFKNIELDLFIRSVNSVIEKVQILQSSYETIEGCLYRSQKFMQCTVIKKNFSPNDLTLGSAWVNQKCYDLFHFGDEPLVRVILAKFESKEQAVVGLSIPHIVMDLKVKNLISNLISKVYNNKGFFDESFIEAIQANNYSNFNDSQKLFLNSDKGRKAADYWCDKVKNTETADINSVKNIFDDVSLDNCLVPLNLSELEFTQLKVFSQNNALSPYIVMLTAYYLLLARYSGESNFCIAVPLSNRKNEKFKSTYGCFVNTLPITIELKKDDDIKSVLKKVRVSLLEAHRYQEFPSVNIINDVAKLRNNRTLYRHGFTFEHPMQLQFNLGEVQSLDCKPLKPQLDLFLRLWESESRLNGCLEFDNALFDFNFAERFTDSLKVLIKDLISDQNKLANKLSFIRVSDQMLINQFNQTEKNYQSALDLKTLFELQVEKTPNATALIYKDKKLSYKEFNIQANKLAHYLIAQGIRQGDAVAIMCERSIDMMIYIYSVIKVGAVYVPIDIELPKKRIDYMMMQADIKAVLSNSLLAPQVDKNHVFLVDKLQDLISISCDLNPNILINPDDLAYIIFTSGSTGVPKGVMNRHQGVSNRLLWMQDEFNATQNDVILQKTPYSFDVSVWEIFWPLQVGAQLAISENNSHRDIYQIHKQVEQYKVTIVHFIPAMLMAFLSARYKDHKLLKTVFCSGESLLSEHSACFYEHYPNSKLINLYGPTEAAIDVTVWRCKPEHNTIPIGKPIANTQAYVVDESLQQLPIGVKGELLIGGVQVAEGYIANKKLTQKVFIDNPFSKGKAYKTGDCVHWNEDGSLTFLGRKDSQIKLNGIRVELSGVNSVIQRYPNILVAVTSIKKNANGNAYIAAYFTKKNVNELLDQSGLKTYLSSILPSYMVPVTFIELATLPLTASGKINHKALAKLKAPEAFETEAEQYKLTNTENEIHAVWCKLLHKNLLPVDRPFFELGGDSMSLMQVFSFLEPIFPNKISSVDMFTYPTIRSLANFIDKSDEPQNKSKIKGRGHKIKGAMFSKPKVRRRKDKEGKHG